MHIRPGITEYVICIPVDVTSLKGVAAGKDNYGNAMQQITANSGDQLIAKLEAELKVEFPALTIKWWLDHDIETELAVPENVGIYKFWFEREVITNAFLHERFELAKSKWLGDRYVPQLHAQGFIENEIDASMYGPLFREELISRLKDYELKVRKTAVLSGRVLADVELLPEDRDNLQQFVASLQHKVTAAETLIINVKKAEVISAAHLATVLDAQVRWSIGATILNRDAQNLVSRLKELIKEINGHEARATLTQYKRNVARPHKVFLGRPGSGKTHALSHATEAHLKRQSPAVIIQAFGTDNRDWGAIMQAGLITTGWSMDEIFNALEAQAVREDRRLASAQGKLGDELSSEPTKVLICLDGLEEATGQWNSWKQRIKECPVLSALFKRLLFVFSSRDYFFNAEEIKSSPVQVNHIPVEGDVSYRQLIKPYFEHYKIIVSSANIIRGIDSLFALRLFCLAYEGQRLDETSNINTAGEKLLNQRIKNMEPEFANKIGKTLGNNRWPVSIGVSVTADIFINSVKIKHDALKALLVPKVSSFLDGNEADLLIDYLADNGILIKTETESSEDGIPALETSYSMTYRSIPELVIASRVAKRIVKGEITNITDATFYGFFNAVPPADSPVDVAEVKQSRIRIRQQIVNILFHEHGKLIGQDDFLGIGLSDFEIFDLRFEAMLKAPETLVAQYKQGVTNFFFGSRQNRMRLLQQQILPASVEAENNFGARYLHELLSNMPSAFERDKIWQGKDSYDGPELSSDSLRSAILGDSNVLELTPYALHDEKPLIYTWCLSTLDQSLRASLRLTLTKWALTQSKEFAKLVTLIFKVADPQIQEDLGSISLGLAGRLKDGDAILAIARAGLAEVFSDSLTNRNVIVRAGFRAIIERAYQFNLLTAEEVEPARPKQQGNIQLINLDQRAVDQPADEIYPIVHDLSWYVIGRSYDGFLKYPDGTGPILKDQDSKAAKALLDLYRNQFPGKSLYAKSWTMAAAIGYIRNLGFDRTNGNRTTKETHGSRSEQFTYEEKYTWLAVSYLKGYLADYVPYNDGDDEDDFIDDYFKIVHVPNSTEYLGSQEIKGYEAFNDQVLQEQLVHQYESGDIGDFIEKEVTEEPAIDFAKWLYFKESQFYLGKSDHEMVALYNDVTQKDNKEYVYTRLEAIACFVPTEQKQTLIELVSANPDTLHFSHHMESLMTSPDTDTYANPSDIVWMNWIEENGTDEEYLVDDEPLQISYALVKIASTGVKGESHWVYPSKTTRAYASIVSNIGSYFQNTHDEVIGYQNKRNSGGISQEIVLLNKPDFDIALKQAGMDLVWFVHLYKSKEHDKNLEHIPHFQRSRKYLVYTDDNNQLLSLQFWNERTSNVRDRFSSERILSLEPIVKAPQYLTEDESKQIKAMIIAGGEVNAANIDERLAAAHKVAFFETEGLILATASIKKPLISYRDKVFKKAKVPEQSVDFEYELGYLYTLPGARGKNLSNRLISTLLIPLDQQVVFSTTHAGNINGYSLMRTMGFSRIGEYFPNANRTDQLALYITKVNAAAVPTEFKIM